jgi:ERCC4-type nuclease
MKILLDYREAACYDVLYELSEELNITLEVTNLKAGDIAIIGERGLLIERKSPNDLLSSIRNNRLFEQMVKLLNMRELEGVEVARVALLIHGELFGYPAIERNYYSQIYGMLMEVSFVYGIPVFFATNDSEMGSFLSTVIKREEAGKNDKGIEARWYREAKNLPQKDPRIYLLSSLPFIGNKLAKNLLDHFGSVSNIANASVKELKEVDLIGEKKAKLIYQIFHNEEV